jgi:hypothetical protein
MGSPKKRSQPAPFFLNSIDRHGRLIEPAVLFTANEIGPRALQYVEKSLGDPAVAISVLEEAAASVSQAIQGRIDAGMPELQNLSAYLFRTFLRLVIM